MAEHRIIYFFPFPPIGAPPPFPALEHHRLSNRLLLNIQSIGMPADIKCGSVCGARDTTQNKFVCFFLVF